MCISDGIACVDQMMDARSELALELCSFQFCSMKLANRFFKTAPSDQPHYIERATIGKITESVDGNDPRMFQRSGYPGFCKKSRLGIYIQGVARQNLFDCNFSFQGCIVGNGYFS